MISFEIPVNQMLFLYNIEQEYILLILKIKSTISMN